MESIKEAIQKSLAELSEEIRVRFELILARNYSLTPIPEDIPENLYMLLNLQKPGLRELSRMLKHYREKVGTEYYNLDITDEKQLEGFLENFVIFVYPKGEYETEQGVSLARMQEKQPDDLKLIMEKLTQDQPKYKDMVDKLIDRKKLTEDETSHLTHMINNPVFQITGYKENLHMLLLPMGRILTEGPLMVAYQWVLLLSVGHTVAERCALKGCKNIFIARSAGHIRSFCSEACKSKAYRRRKKNASPSS